MPDDRIAAILAGLLPPPVATDAMPFPILLGQQYAADKLYNPLTGFSPLIPDPNQLVGSVAGPVSAAGRLPRIKGEANPSTRAQKPTEREVEKAFEVIRKETAGMTREQRREQMREAGGQEFNRVQDMSDAEWAAELEQIRSILKR
jgi:hypothetical protein